MTNVLYNYRINQIVSAHSEVLELAQFPVAARIEGRVYEADLQVRHNLCLYQASSRGGGCNLARFGSPEPGL